jgi:quinol monooxygenase YgiN
MTVLVAVLQAKPGKEAALEAELKAIVLKVQTEANALCYALHRAEGNPGKFLVYEKYTDKAALDFHLSAAYMKEMLSNIESLLSEAPALTLYEEIAAIKRR